MLHSRGLRYRIHFPVPGLPRRTIDIAFPRRRLAVFVDGCYWHGCPEHGKRPAVNTDWWEWKIGGNIARDQQTIQALEKAGWTAIRIWEHVPTEQAARSVMDALAEIAD